MNSEEIWKDILGYEGLYQVSSYGRVRSLDRYDERNRFLRGRILKLHTLRRGYLDVRLCSNGKVKSFLVHRLVAEIFIPNPDNLPQVNHRDENPSNDNVDNLEWCDGKYNVNYGTRIDRIRDIKLKNGTYFNLNDEERKIYLKEYKKKYYQEKKDKWKEYNKKWYQEHKNEHKEQQREYYHKNREKLCEQKKEYRRKKKEEIQNNL